MGEETRAAQAWGNVGAIPRAILAAFDRLLNRIDMTPTELQPAGPVPGFYRHYKGRYYQVMDLVRHSESEEWRCCTAPA
ncbi:DUF1653 domain-containing protein, partial [Acinetobacter baumannii]